MSPARRPTREPRPLLKRLDQVVVALASLAALVSIVGYWAVQGGTRGRLIDIDRAPRQTVQFQLDVNAAQWPELTVLPGIGESLARRIVESRRERGPFADLEDLQRVRGIGPKTLEQIRPFVRPIPAQQDVAGR